MIINLQDSIIKDYGTNKKVSFFYALRMLFSTLLFNFKYSAWSDIYAAQALYLKLNNKELNNILRA